MSSEEKKLKRRRSSLCPNRISLLPTDVTGNVGQNLESAESKKLKSQISDCILSALETVNGEIMKSDGISLLPPNPQNAVDDIVDMLDFENQKKSEENEIAKDVNPISEQKLKEIEEIMQTKIDRCNEECMKWEELLKKMEDEAKSDSQLHPNKTILYQNISDSVKDKVSTYMPSHFSCKDILHKCQKMADETFMLMEDSVKKTNLLFKTQQNMNSLLDSQYKIFNVQVQEATTVDGDVRQLIENRISIISPGNNGK